LAETSQRGTYTKLELEFGPKRLMGANFSNLRAVGFGSYANVFSKSSRSAGVNVGMA
jgi:hypothetical protein